MKFLRFFFCFVLLGLLSVTVSFAQKKDKLSSLPDDATLEETQAWLVRAIGQNASYTSKVIQSVKDPGKTAKDQTGYSDNKVSEVKFQGSILTYTMDRTTQLDASASSKSLPPERERVKVQIDLKDINPDEITLQEIDADKKLHAISLRTFNYKRSIRLKSSEMGDVGVSVANIMVGENIAEQVQAALIHAVKLCQAAKP